MSRRTTMPFTRIALRVSTIAVLALGAAGCGSGGLSGFDLPGSGASAPVAGPSKPPVAMAGRWMLASPGRGQCNMNFRSAAPDASEGTIAPEGGCPGKFFTSRRWAYDSTGLSIRDHNSEPLAQLSADGSRFDGKSTAGEPVTLTR